MRRFTVLVLTLACLASGLEGCAALVGGAAGAAVYGAADNADHQDRNRDN